MSVGFAVLMGLGMAITLGVLFTGLIAMARGGEFNDKYANKLAQAIALLFFALAMLTSKG